MIIMKIKNLNYMTCSMIHYIQYDITELQQISLELPFPNFDLATATYNYLDN